MNHSDKSNPEDTSGELEESLEEIIEEKIEEIAEEIKEEEVIEVEVEEGGEKEALEEAPAEESEEWICDICDTTYSGSDPFKIQGYHEDICGQCYDRGLMWCIKEAWKWRSQIRIDVIRKPKDE